MNISEQENILIKKYLTNTLGDDYKSVFDESLKSSHFRNELMKQAKLIDALEIIEEDLIRDELKILDDHYNSSKSKSKNKKPSSYIKLISLVGVALLLAAIAYYLFTKPSSNNYQQFAEVYSTPFPAKEYDRGDTFIDNPKNYDDAMKLYAEGKYSNALNLFLTIDNKSSEDKLYIANCYIGMKDYTKAKQILSPLTFNDNESLRFNKDWYLLICEMGLGNNNTVNSLLENIKDNPQHLFYNKALELEREINK